MSSNAQSISRTYAQLLFELAIEQNCAQQVESQLESLCEVLELEVDFATLLANPFAAREEKIALAKKIFSSRLNALTLASLCSLIRTNKLELLKDILDLYKLLLDSAADTPLIKITLAADIPKEQKQYIEEQLAQTLSKTIRAKFTIDPSIIGGIIIRYENYYVDNSLLRVLEDAKKLLQSKVLI